MYSCGEESCDMYLLRGRHARQEDNWGFLPMLAYMVRIASTNTTLCMLLKLSSPLLLRSFIMVCLQPGTGKSTTIWHIINSRVAPDARTLVTCTRNQAVDAVTQKVATFGVLVSVSRVSALYIPKANNFIRFVVVCSTGGAGKMA